MEEQKDAKEYTLTLSVSEMQAVIDLVDAAVRSAGNRAVLLAAPILAKVTEAKRAAGDGA